MRVSSAYAFSILSLPKTAVNFPDLPQQLPGHVLLLWLLKTSQAVRMATALGRWSDKQVWGWWAPWSHTWRYSVYSGNPDRCVCAAPCLEKRLTASWGVPVLVAGYWTIWAWLGFIYLEHSLLRTRIRNGHRHQILGTAWEFVSQYNARPIGNTVLY